MDTLRRPGAAARPLGAFAEPGRIEKAGSGFAITILAGWTVEVAEPDPAIAHAELGTAWEALRAVAPDGGMACSFVVGVAAVSLSDAYATEQDGVTNPHWDQQDPRVLLVPTPEVPDTRATHAWPPSGLRIAPTWNTTQYSLLCVADDARGREDDASLGNPDRIVDQLIESFEILPVRQ